MRKPLYSEPLSISSSPSASLTRAFGGRRSRQLSYGRLGQPLNTRSMELGQRPPRSTAAARQPGWNRSQWCGSGACVVMPGRSATALSEGKRAVGPQPALRLGTLPPHGEAPRASSRTRTTRTPPGGFASSSGKRHVPCSRPNRQLPIFDTSQGIDPACRLRGPGRRGQGPGIHSMFIHKKALHSPKKVQ